jgi:RNA polymerase sigma factor (sigma-70 family)
MDKPEEEIIDEHYGLAKSLAQGFYRKTSAFSFDDLLQVSLIGIIKAHRKHNPQKSKFSTFATHCVRHDLIKFIKKNPESITYPDPRAEYHTELQISDYFPESLTNTEKEIVILLNSKYKNHEIRRKLDIKKLAYDKAIKSCLRKIRVANG